MRKPISLPLPKCAECGKTLEPQFITELEDGDESKPEVLMMYGKCDDCKAITMCDIIKTKDIPTEKDYDADHEDQLNVLDDEVKA